MTTGTTVPTPRRFLSWSAINGFGGRVLPKVQTKNPHVLLLLSEYGTSKYNFPCAILPLRFHKIGFRHSSCSGFVINGLQPRKYMLLSNRHYKALPISVFMNSRRSKRICINSSSCCQLSGSEWQQVLRSSRNFSSSPAYVFHHCLSQTCSNKIALREANRERSSSLLRSDVKVPVVTWLFLYVTKFSFICFLTRKQRFQFS